MKLQYAVLFYEGPEDYWMQVPDLPGCFSAGDDLEDARRMVKEAMTLWLEVSAEHGEPIPQTTMTTHQAMEWNDAQLGDEELIKILGGEPDDALSTHAEMIEVEVNLPNPASR